MVSDFRCGTIVATTWVVELLTTLIIWEVSMTRDIDDTVTRYTLSINFVEQMPIGPDPADHKVRVNTIMAAAERIRTLLHNDQELQAMLQQQQVRLEAVLTQP
jgi:hypothetical protein